MIQDSPEIVTREGKMTTFLCHPHRGGPFPTVLLLMDAMGMRDELRDMARRIATAGYYVLLPNLYYRSNVIELGPFAEPIDEAGRTQVNRLVSSLTIRSVMDDVEALLRYARDRPDAQDDRCGCVGYCMSGQYAINAAARFPSRVLAAASIYGTSLITGEPDSPNVVARAVRGELYFACAEIDGWTSVDTVEALTKDLAEAGVRADVELYPGTYHGFAFPERPVYDEAAAERHWDRLLGLFRRCLG
jgi:carboxymethylenebutenolidase